MLAVAKTPHTELRIEGEVPPALLLMLKKTFGKDLKVEEESINIRDTSWYQKKKMTPAMRVKEYRGMLEYTQAQLGQILGGKSRQYISDIENDRRSISLDVAKKLSETFQTSVQNFI